MKIIKPRWKAAWNYVKGSDSFINWRISRSPCPNCRGKLFLSMRRDPFMIRCLSCRANALNLALIPVIERHSQRYSIDTVWEMSTYGATLDFLEKNFPTVLSSEYFPDVVPGELVNGVLNQDVQNLSFEDQSIDLITSNQVFEHVRDDIKGYEECYRVLKKKGALIFSVPMYDNEKTLQLADSVGGEVIFYGEPEYHDSRISGPKSVLTYWRHSCHDIADRVSSVGFSARVVDVAVTRSQKIPAKVVYAVKY